MLPVGTEKKPGPRKSEPGSFEIADALGRVPKKLISRQIQNQVENVTEDAGTAV